MNSICYLDSSILGALTLKCLMWKIYTFNLLLCIINLSNHFEFIQKKIKIQQKERILYCL